MKVSWFELHSGKSIPKWYGFAYCDFCRAFDMFYPIPLNFLIRYGRRLYWGFLRLFYWIGLVDVGMAEAFSWRDFYRIKSH